jgi:lysophospholipase L1-like esterase
MKKNMIRPVAALIAAVMLTGCGKDTIVTKERDSESPAGSEAVTLDKSGAGDSGETVAEGSGDFSKDSTSKGDPSKSGASDDNSAGGKSSEESSSQAGTSAIAGAASAEGNSSVTKAADEDDELVIVMLGDDQFASGRDKGTSIADYTKEMTGACIINLGCSGTKAAVLSENSDDNKGPVFPNIARYFAGEADASVFDSYPDVKEMAQSVDPARVDYYVIEYGINDFKANIPMDDALYKDNITNFINAVRVGIRELQKASPNARIVCCSPVFTLFKKENGEQLGSSNVYRNNYGTLADYASNEVNAAAQMGALTLELCGQGYMDIGDLTASQYLESDGMHLTSAGRRTFAAVLSHVINKDLGKDNTSLDDGPYRIEDYM